MIRHFSKAMGGDVALAQLYPGLGESREGIQMCEIAPGVHRSS
jgi:hypothetical protein